MLKIASWNINSIRARLPHLIQWLNKAEPTVVLLQETKVIDELFPREEIEDLGFNIAAFGQKSYNGVAILSKLPIEDIRYGLPGNENGSEARYIEAVVGGIRVASIYVPNGQSKTSDRFPYKLQFMERLYQHIKGLLSYEEKLVLGGDFNITLTDQDVYDPVGWKEEILCSTPERESLRKVLFLGLTDALRSLHPKNSPEGKNLYTWWDYRAGSWQNNQGLRIDHLFLSPHAADSLASSGVDLFIRSQVKPSDHAPVWCELKNE